MAHLAPAFLFMCLHVFLSFLLSLIIQVRFPWPNHVGSNSSLFISQVSVKLMRSLNWICGVRTKMWGSSCSIYRCSNFIVSLQFYNPCLKYVWFPNDFKVQQFKSLLCLCVSLLQLTALWRNVLFPYLLFHLLMYLVTRYGFTLHLITLGSYGYSSPHSYLI